MRIYKGVGQRSEYWGPEKFTGRESGRENWAGVGRPPLSVPADNCELYFHSDGSVEDWGVSVDIYGIYEEPTPEELEAAETKASAKAGQSGLACWFLGLVSSQAHNPAVRRVLCSRASLKTIRDYLTKAGTEGKTWLVDLVSGLFVTLKDLPLQDREGAAEVAKLVRDLADLTTKQAAVEESSPAEEKSPLLLSLLQASALGRALPTTSFDVGPSKAPVLSGEGLTWDAEKLGPEMTILDGGSLLRWGTAPMSLNRGPRWGYAAPVLSKKGVVTWTVRIRACHADEMRVGILTQKAGGPAENYLWYANKLYAPNNKGKPARFGPKILQGDVVSIIMDMSADTLSFARNGVPLGVAFGPVGSGAVVENSERMLVAGITRPGLAASSETAAEILTPLVDIVAHAGDNGQASSAAVASSDRRDGTSVGVLDKLMDVSNQLRELTGDGAGVLPSDTPEADACAPEAVGAAVVESAHPVPEVDGPIEHVVDLPGALGAMVLLDKRTGMADGYTVVFEDAKGPSPALPLEVINVLANAHLHTSTIGKLWIAVC
jgi:hypothetical protein